MTTDPRLSGWENYYVIVGSSGAALIGLQFVVMTLIAGMRRGPNAAALSAFGTPTVVHLSGALVVSALMSAPWPALAPVAATLALYGLGGLGYVAVVLRRARRQTDYEPVWEDWLWFLLLPGAAYATLALGALLLGAATASAEFLIGAAALALLLIGVHNSWDTVTHLVVGANREAPARPEEPRSEATAPVASEEAGAPQPTRGPVG